MLVLFEPYQFQPNLRDYGIYVNKKSESGLVEAYGEYDQYSNQEYYHTPAIYGTPHVTEPMEEQISSVVQANSATAEEFSSSSQEMSQLAVNLQNEVDNFHFHS
jgi:methyl-accepting chemotaxis protein